PARIIPTACSGLLDERGKIGPVASPAHATSSPSGPSTTTDPWWRPSTKPDRVISATSSPPAYTAARASLVALPPRDSVAAPGGPAAGRGCASGSLRRDTRDTP